MLTIVFLTAIALVIIVASGGYAYSLFEIGNAYNKGWGVQTDMGNAVIWYRKAATAGSAKAEFNLGVSYLHGLGVPRDDSQAYLWFRKSADHGFANARYAMALAYLTGRGVPKDTAAGIDLLRLASEQGIAEAQCLLADIYVAGVSVPRNEALALEWYRKAANQGLQSAKPKLEELEKQLKSGEVNQSDIASAESSNTPTHADTDRQVRILVAGGQRIDAPGPQVVTGDVIQAASLITIIFFDSPCTLDIEGAASMRRAWQNAGAYQLGCWYPGRGGDWQFMGQIDRMDYHHTDPWEAMPRALLHADGSATITEPNYDSRTFMSDWYSRRNAHLFDHLHDKP